MAAFPHHGTGEGEVACEHPELRTVSKSNVAQTGGVTYKKGFIVIIFGTISFDDEFALYQALHAGEKQSRNPLLQRIILYSLFVIFDLNIPFVYYLAFRKLIVYPNLVLT